MNERGLDPWVDLKVEAPPEEAAMVQKALLDWSRQYGRDKCKYGNQCVHCCPVCCTTFEWDGLTLVNVTMRFEPKEPKE